MADPLVMNLRSLIRVNQYVTQDEYHFLTRFARLLSKYPENVAVFHPLYGAGKLEDLLTSYKVRGGHGWPTPSGNKPNLTIRTEAGTPEIVRPQGFLVTTAEKFLLSAIHDEPADEQLFYIVLDADLYLHDLNFQVLVREFAFQSMADERCIKNLYLVAPTNETPPKLNRYVSKIIDPGLTPSEIKEHLTEIARHLNLQAPGDLDSYAGLTLYELEEVCRLCVITTKKEVVTMYHPGVIAEYRRTKGLPVPKGFVN
jgi:hypothetical protein